MQVRELVQRANDIGASDLHITVQRQPTFRVNGTLITFPEDPILNSEDTERLANQLIPDPKLKERLLEVGQVDFSNALQGIGRFRVNLYIQRGSHAAAIRMIPFHVPKLEGLGIPPVARELAMLDRGMVLVTGPTGSGKSTTLAAMIGLLNTEKALTIITLEDPIEYLHRHDKCIINQREVGVDTNAFADALRAALRQDPDVILVGEMRDLETISTAVTAAETGHLVLASLHSSSAAQTIDRIIDVFPPHQQPQIRVQLAANLQGVIAQQLVPRSDTPGRCIALEIMVCTPAVRNLIREGKTHQISSVLQTGGAQGMVTMDKSLKSLYQAGKISYEELSKRISSKDNL
ncbi:MAG: type IV pilus twitching motility protein PilT [Candidatus Saccharibacteria bacterium]